MNQLFSEYKIREKTIKNRVVMPPMVCPGWSDEQGLVTDKHVRHYENRARGGTGLIIIEACCVEKEGRIFDTQLGIWSDAHIEGLGRIAAACRNHGAVALLQLHHGGLRTSEDISGKMPGPSSHSWCPGSHAMTVEEIHSMRDSFTAAAIRARDAGMDGVELHGAHGYFLSQFASRTVNLREDAYGGSVENRMRLADEIIKDIRRACGEGFIIGYRLGANEPLLEDGIRIAREVERSGADLLHVSASGFSEEYPHVPDGLPYNWIVYSAGEIRRSVKLPVIAVNGIRTPERAAWLVENGFADFTAIGMDLLADAEWANKAREGSSIHYCLKCRQCGRFTRAELCPRYRE